MRAVLSLLLVMGLLGAIAPFREAHAEGCRSVFTKRLSQDVLEAKREVVRKLVELGLDRHAYVVEWEVGESHQGPKWDRRGATVVLGLEKSQYSRWIEQVGSRSIGFMVNGLPEWSPGTAILRVGKEIYYWDRIIDGTSGGSASSFQLGNYLRQEVNSGRTEATFFVSPGEMKAIRRFLNERMRHRILAKEDIRGKRGVRFEKGAPIWPDFSITGKSLAKESCAGACMSFIDPRWLTHYDAPAPLRALAERLELEHTHVAKRMVWSNSRNPHLSMLTLFGIEFSGRGLLNDFIRNNSWQPLQGHAVWARIPDPKGSSESVRSVRIPLEEWLR